MSKIESAARIARPVTFALACVFGGIALEAHTAENSAVRVDNPELATEFNREARVSGLMALSDVAAFIGMLNLVRDQKKDEGLPQPD